jgi:hypothetical protein
MTDTLTISLLGRQVLYVAPAAHSFIGSLTCGAVDVGQYTYPLFTASFQIGMLQAQAHGYLLDEALCNLKAKVAPLEGWIDAR